MFAKYSRINVMATVIIFLIASTAFYFTLHFVFINQIDEDLKIEQNEIETYVKEHNQLPESISVNDQRINYQLTAGSVKPYFATKFISTHKENEKEKFRQLIFSISAAGQFYQVTVSKSMEETENLTQSILLIAFTTILVILLVAFVINRVLLKRIWKPFYQSLDAVKEFKLGSRQTIQLPSSNIEEFQLMNETLKKITSKAQLDYLSLKTFSENASHEIQTPLAVIRSKLDLMIQDEHLTEKQSELVQAAFNSVQKLSKLNQSLLLLAKIENNQFHEKVSVDVKKKIEEKIADFNELWTAHELKVKADLNKVCISMNEELLEILLNNLLSNATRHNYDGGKINVVLNDAHLKIANTSKAPALDKHTLYLRFAKPSYKKESNSLGLSIIKQICDSSGCVVNYFFEDELHIFLIDFRPVLEIGRDES